MNSIVVFCGASGGNKASYRHAANLLGATLAAWDIQLVYGGAKVGMMGAVADSALKAGGHVIGVIPEFLQKIEVVHEGLSELIVVNNMHERKLKMHELSDAIIALPGGWGTMEELFEMLTWAQLGLHSKPIGLLNVDGYYNHLIGLCDHMVKEQFLPANVRQMLLSSESIDDLLAQMESWKPEAQEKILTEHTT